MEGAPDRQDLRKAFGTAHFEPLNYYNGHRWVNAERPDASSYDSVCKRCWPESKATSTLDVLAARGDSEDSVVDTDSVPSEGLSE